MRAMAYNFSWSKLKELFIAGMLVGKRITESTRLLSNFKALKIQFYHGFS